MQCKRFISQKTLKKTLPDEQRSLKTDAQTAKLVTPSWKFLMAQSIRIYIGGHLKRVSSKWTVEQSVSLHAAGKASLLSVCAKRFTLRCPQRFRAAAQPDPVYIQDSEQSWALGILKFSGVQLKKLLPGQSHYEN